MSRWWLLGAVALAAGFITAVALHGERPMGGVMPYQVRGFLAAHAADAVREVEIEIGGRRDRLMRAADGTWPGVPPERGRAIELGIALLRETAPERSISGEELAGARLGGIRLADYGLNPPALTVIVRGPQLGEFSIAFGGANPLGQSRYARVGGREIWLVPRHVAEAWEEAAKSP